MSEDKYQTCECGESRPGCCWRRHATCIICGERSVVNERPDCRYCGEVHEDVHCFWDHSKMGLPGYETKVFAQFTVARFELGNWADAS